MAFTKIAAAGIGSTETVTLHSLEVINNATVGGVLTYEDVTNVDSIGLITARNGIVVGSGITLSKDGDGFYTGVVTATTFKGSGQFLTGIDTDLVSDTSPQLGGNLASNGKLIKFGDSSGATDDRLTFGNGDDIQIYYSTSNLYITQATGDIILENNADDKDVSIKTDNGSGGTANYFVADGSTGEALLYHYGSEKIKTTSSGVTVTGTVAATSYTGDGSSLTGIAATANVRTGILDVAGISTFRDTMNVGAAVTISESGIEASGIGITIANINGKKIGGKRNIWINGGMEVAERATSTTGTGYCCVDRWVINNNAGTITKAKHGLTNNDTGPWEEGIRHCLRLTNTSAIGSGSGSYAEAYYRPEARDLAMSGWDYNNANAFITLSYWARASVAQAYPATIKMGDWDYYFPWNFTIAQANVWQKFVIKIPGHSSMTINNDNGIGFTMWINAYQGSNYFAGGGYTENTWNAESGSYMFAGSPTTTWGTTASATWDITGFQLEVGPEATPFETRSYADELQSCRRYYQRHAAHGDHYMFGLARAESNTARTGITVPVPMRAAPTVACNGSRTFREGYVSESTSTPSIYASSSWIDTAPLYTIDFGGHNLDHNYMYALMSKTTSTNALELDAEL